MDEFFRNGWVDDKHVGWLDEWDGWMIRMDGFFLIQMKRIHGLKHGELSFSACFSPD